MTNIYLIAGTGLLKPSIPLGTTVESFDIGSAANDFLNKRNDSILRDDQGKLRIYLSFRLADNPVNSFKRRLLIFTEIYPKGFCCEDFAWQKPECLSLTIV